MNIEHVIPAQWGSYVDVMSMWRTRQVPLGDDTPPIYDAADPAAVEFGRGLSVDTVRVFWSLIDVPPPTARRWAAIAVYIEALDDVLETMLPEHVAHWERFKAIVSHYDAVVVHTPAMASRIRASCRGGPPVFVVPLGWSPKAWGRSPVGQRHIHHDLAWWGSPVGRRAALYPQLDAWCVDQGVRGINLTGKFGRELIGALDHVGCVVYVAHSRVRSYSTWRLWQCMAASVPVISEPVGAMDSWPFVPDVDFTRVPYLDDAGGWDDLETLVSRWRVPNLATVAVPKTALDLDIDEVQFTYWRGVAQQAWLAFEGNRG